MLTASEHAIRQYFSRSAIRYHEHAKFQQKIASSLAERSCDSFQPASILELGCGTGFLTKLLVDHYPTASIDAVDISSDMIQLAKQTLPTANICWRVEDMNQISTHQQFDLVASSTALHWGDPVEQLIQRIAQLIRPGGKLIAAVMTAGTLDELHRIRQSVAPQKVPLQQLPSEQQLTHALAEAQLTISSLTTETYVQHFSSSRDLLRQLRLTGFTGGPFSRTDGESLVRSELQAIATQYQQQHANSAGQVSATFKATYLEASAPTS